MHQKCQQEDKNVCKCVQRCLGPANIQTNILFPGVVWFEEKDEEEKVCPELLPKQFS